MVLLDEHHHDGMSCMLHDVNVGVVHAVYWHCGPALHTAWRAHSIRCTVHINEVYEVGRQIVKSC